MEIIELLTSNVIGGSILCFIWAIAFIICMAIVDNDYVLGSTKSIAFIIGTVSVVGIFASLTFVLTEYYGMLS